MLYYATLSWAIAACAAQAPDTECLESLDGVPPVQLVSPASLTEQLRESPPSNAERLAMLRELFAAAGCEPRLIEQAVPRAGLPNLVCSLPGTTESRVVVGAHFDKVNPGRGVADNWSGAVLLPALYQGLAQRPRRHSFTFVAFTAEEDGQLGSKAFVRGLDPARREDVIAMVNLDTLGLGASSYEGREADPSLACLLQATANLTGETVTARNNGIEDSSDHEPFRDAGIPAIRLHSLTAATTNVIHSRRDRFEAIDQAAYYSSYRLIATYLMVIDRYNGANPRK